jgi:hypothetical protein
MRALKFYLRISSKYKRPFTFSVPSILKTKGLTVTSIEACCCRPFKPQTGAFRLLIPASEALADYVRRTCSGVYKQPSILISPLRHILAKDTMWPPHSVASPVSPKHNQFEGLSGGSPYDRIRRFCADGQEMINDLSIGQSVAEKSCCHIAAYRGGCHVRAIEV